VNVTSVADVRGEKGIGGYGVSEAALARLAAQLALELGPSVGVNAVAPGFTLTDGTPPRARETRTGLLWRRSRR
jgi:NAD(P)-dependent dehydrogenase (short-subunit alcohol dehydrogenase family)